MRAQNALGASFNERVWFPGEWEEVKAVVVTTRYEYLVPGHENDRRYSAEQLVKNWGNQYYQEDDYSQAKLLGEGPVKSKVDVETQNGKPFLYVMDGIQKARAEAWVRIEEAGDEAIIRTAMQQAGLRTDKMKFFVAPGNTFWFRDCGPICFYYGDDDKIGMLDFFYGYTRPCDDLLPSVLHWKFGIPNYQSDLIWEGGNCLVDGIPVTYYLSATSNNGKTVTKPINAQKGSLYGFTITSAAKYDKDQFDYATEPAPEDQIKFQMANSLIREDTSTEPTPTGIVEIKDEKREMENTRKGWYTISGMPLNQKPTTKGIYIYSGKKVVIK